MANINLEIGEIHNGKIEYSSGLPYSLRQPAIWRHSRKTWFVCSALMMPGWKECDHKFFSIVEGEKRIIPYPHEWIAQFNKEKEAWTWFRIMASAVKLSNAEHHLKLVKARRMKRNAPARPEDIKGVKVEEIIIDEIAEDNHEPQEPEQGDLFGEKE